MAVENVQDTITNINAVLALLRTLGYDVSTITVDQLMAILPRIQAVFNEELNTA